MKVQKRLLENLFKKNKFILYILSIIIFIIFKIHNHSKQYNKKLQDYTTAKKPMMQHFRSHNRHKKTQTSTSIFGRNNTKINRKPILHSDFFVTHRTHANEKRRSYFVRRRFYWRCALIITLLARAVPLSKNRAMRTFVSIKPKRDGVHTHERDEGFISFFFLIGEKFVWVVLVLFFLVRSYMILNYQ